MVDLTACRDIEVSYALRFESFIGAAFVKKHEIINALKDSNFKSFLRDLVPIPETKDPVDVAPAATDA